MIWQHFENEFYLRLDRGFGRMIKKEDEQVQKYLDGAIKSLDRNSIDYFSILNE